MVTYPPVPDQTTSFSVRLRRRAHRCRSWLCIGLDPEVKSLPPGIPRTASGVADFCIEIVEATRDLAAAFKPNFAFFEALGPDGWSALNRVRRAIPSDVPVIADAKRGDIGNTDEAYARAILEVLDFDAVTVSPYLGWDSVTPFLRYSGKAALVLCKTSNPGAADLQDLQVAGFPLYMHVARGALALDGEAGLVIGATQPEALRRVRALSPDAIFLVPGVGAQGASARQAVEDGANGDGDNALVSVSRQIIFASPGPDFAQGAASAAERFANDTWIHDRAHR